MAGAVIRVSGEFDDAALRKAQLALKKFGMNVESAGKTSGKGFDTLKTKTVALGAAIARVGTDIAYWLGRQAWSALTDSIKFASDFNETLSKTNVIFGKNSNAILKFSKDAATAFGQTQTQAMDAAAQFGIFGQSAGLTGTGLTDFSTKLTGLASDLASFNNTTVDEAITALGAGLRGESEPLRRFGVLLNDQVLRQAALEAGITKTTKKALTPQQRVLAAYNVIMKQTKLQQGDFARTSGGLANQQRILTAQIGNLKTQLGQFLLPVLTKIITFITSKVAPAFANLGEIVDKYIKPAFEKLGITQANLKASFELYGQAVMRYIEIMKPAFMSLVGALEALWNAWKVIGDVLMNFIEPAFKGIVAVFTGVYQFIANLLRPALDGLKWAFNVIADAVERNKEPLSALMGFLGKIVEIIGNVLRPILSWLGSFLGGVLKLAFQALGLVIAAIITTIADFVRVIQGIGTFAVAAKDAAVGAFNLIAGAVDNLWDKFTGFIGKIASAAGTMFAPLYDAFKGVINSLISAWNSLDFAINIAVPSWVPGIGGKGFHIADIFPDIPYLAEGGIVNSPTLAMIGEAGPEAVIPLSKAGTAGVGGITVQAGAIQVNIGSLDGMGRTDIQAIVDQAFQKSMTQLARDIRSRR